MAANKCFEIILNQVKLSNLNFPIVQPPFSATISLMKYFVKDKSGLPLEPPLTEPNHLSHLETSNKVLNKKVFNFECRNESLRKELENAPKVTKNVEIYSDLECPEKYPGFD